MEKEQALLLKPWGSGKVVRIPRMKERHEQAQSETRLG
jgi:hypothetical protein